MKKLIALTLLLCTFALSLSSCGNSVKIEKPEDTNLEYWLLDSSNMSDCTQLYNGGAFVESFLANGYEAVPDEKGNLVAPKEAVVYDVEMYPYRDIKYGAKRISCIRITDPNVYVWGLTINSTREEIIKTLEKVGYKIYQDYEDSITLRINSDWYVHVEFGKKISMSHETYFLYHLRLDIPYYLFLD